MLASDNQSSAAGFVADPPPKLDAMTLRRARVAETWQHTKQVQDAQQTRLQRRARRLGLALMVASCVVSILAVYGIWILLRGLI
jgi:hypothetical protein